MAGLTFGEKLADLRVKNRMTQKELGKVIGVNERTVSSYETDQARPHYDKVVKIAHFFHVSYDYLMCTETYDQVTTVDFGKIYVDNGDEIFTMGELYALINSLDEKARTTALDAIRIIKKNPMFDIENLVKAMKNITE